MSEVMTTLTQSIDPTIKEYYVKTLLQNTEPKLVYSNFGDKTPIPKGHGKTLEWRKFSKLPKALTPLTEGVTPKGNKLSMTTVTGSINQYGDWIALSDIVQLAALDNLVVQSTKQLGSQAGRTMDTVVREVVCGGTNVMYAPSIAADGTETEVLSRATLKVSSKLTVGLLLKAATFLQAMDIDAVEDGDSYVCVLHPYAAYDVKRDPEWKVWQQNTNSERLYKNEIGKIGKIRFVESSEAKIITGEGCPSGLAVFETMIIGGHAYGVTELEGAGLQHIIKPLGYGEDPLNQRASVGWKATQGAQRLSEEAMIRIEHTTSYSATAQAN